MSGEGDASGAIDPAAVTLLVIAKEPAPGKAKTRLAPALGPEGAAALAEAALADTLAAVAAVRPERRLLLALDGDPGAWLPAGFEIVAQRGTGLAERLAGAFEDAAGPAFLVGMDTPQVGATTIAAACETLCRPGVDAVIGRAGDGGWWGLGLREPDRRVFAGVPMSEGHTGAMQVESLRALGLRFEELEQLDDVDTIDDAHRVAAAIPGSRFARTLERLTAAGRSEQT